MPVLGSKQEQTEKDGKKCLGPASSGRRAHSARVCSSEWNRGAEQKPAAELRAGHGHVQARRGLRAWGLGHSFNLDIARQAAASCMMRAVVSGKQRVYTKALCTRAARVARRRWAQHGQQARRQHGAAQHTLGMNDLGCQPQAGLISRQVGVPSSGSRHQAPLVTVSDGAWARGAGLEHRDGHLLLLQELQVGALQPGARSVVQRQALRPRARGRLARLGPRSLHLLAAAQGQRCAQLRPGGGHFEGCRVRAAL